MIPISDDEFRKLTEHIKDNYGINLTQKKVLVMGRLCNFLADNNFKSFSEYMEYVVSDKTGSAAEVLINKITTNHTYFMREPEHFDYFRNVVLPYLEVTQSSKKDIRIWSAGCSSGEEPYTLAMILDGYFSSEKLKWDTKILATDISTKVLEKATNGVYLDEQISSIPDIWKRTYFKKIEDGRYGISDKIRNEVIFRKFNLMADIFPFKNKFHVIFCRNVMIYFDNDTKKDLANKFYDHLEPGGYLFIGHSESLNHIGSRFKYIMPAVYRKV